MNKFHKIMTKVYESLVPDEETQDRIARRIVDIDKIKIR